jgi:hypothetical protein
MNIRKVGLLGIEKLGSVRVQKATFSRLDAVLTVWKGLRAWKTFWFLIL